MLFVEIIKRCVFLYKNPSVDLIPKILKFWRCHLDFEFWYSYEPLCKCNKIQIPAVKTIKRSVCCKLIVTNTICAFYAEMQHASYIMVASVLKFSSQIELESVSGLVIQANGRLKFEDDLRSGGLQYFTSQWTSVCNELADSLVTLGEPGGD